MKRFLSFLAASAFVAASLHAQSAPQGNQNRNNNQNQPQVQLSPQGAGQTQGTPANTTNNPSGARPATAQSPGTGTQTPAVQPGNATQPQNSEQKANATASDATPGGAVGAPVKQPTTEILPEGKPLPSADPVMEPGELPRGSLTLLGGTALKVDRLRNRITLQPFGGGNRLTIRFDERSHIYRDGRETTVSGIREGDRVYADTQLFGPYVFARTIRVQTTSGPAEARGQVTRYDARTGHVTMTDQLTSQPVTFTISRQTAFRSQGNATASAADIMPGSLIDVLFAPGNGASGDATEISVLAKPGDKYVFAGRVTNLDIRVGVLSVDNQTDGKNYDVYFDPSRVEGRQQLRIGSDITARATFDGQTYRASDITVSNVAEDSAQQ